MRKVAMYFSILQAPRCRIDAFASFWWEGFCSVSKTCKNGSGSRLLASSAYRNGGGHDGRWTRRPLITRTERRNKDVESSKPKSIKQEILDETVVASTRLNIKKSEISEFQRAQYIDIEQKISENPDLASLVTVIVFDIETTGLSREHDRIIEIALQDLAGGENSTFQTFVNPERNVPNEHVHGIDTHMVNKTEVPRMVDLIPILMQYVRSRQKPGGSVLWIAHNARSFDVPVFYNEFRRCGIEIPEDWLFADSLALARELKKSGGSKIPPGSSLQALREFYGIELDGPAHRAMSDVKSLSLILQRLTFDLKLTLPCLLERSFKALDAVNLKKKKKKKKNSS